MELWSADNQPEVTAITGNPTIGGVEIHSPTQLYDFDPEPTTANCAALGGKPCWSDGSSLAYVEKFAPMIQAGQTVLILHELADWHTSHFAARADSSEGAR